MNQIDNETRAAVTCNFRLLGFVLLILALRLGSVAANAAQMPQPFKPNCAITSINTKTGVVTASIIDGGTATLKASGGVKSFRFFVKDATLLNSLKVGDAIFADFNTHEVFTSTGPSGQLARLGGILSDSFGNSSATPAGNTSRQPSKFSEPVTPGSGTNPVAPVDGAKLQAQKVLPPNGAAEPVAPVDGAKLGNGANPGEPCCQITGTNP